MNTLLTLPQLKASFLHPLPSVQVLLVAGGTQPVPGCKKLPSAGKSGVPTVAVEACRKAGIPPLRLIGDGDSASGGHGLGGITRHTD